MSRARQGANISRETRGFRTRSANSRHGCCSRQERAARFRSYRLGPHLVDIELLALVPGDGVHCIDGRKVFRVVPRQRPCATQAARSALRGEQGVDAPLNWCLPPCCAPPTAFWLLSCEDRPLKALSWGCLLAAGAPLPVQHRLRCSLHEADGPATATVLAAVPILQRSRLLANWRCLGVRRLPLPSGGCFSLSPANCQPALASARHSQRRCKTSGSRPHANMLAARGSRAQLGSAFCVESSPQAFSACLCRRVRTAMFGCFVHTLSRFVLTAHELLPTGSVAVQASLSSIRGSSLRSKC